jgi:hypothetical protein
LTSLRTHVEVRHHGNSCGEQAALALGADSVCQLDRRFNVSRSRQLVHKAAATALVQ